MLSQRDAVAINAGHEHLVTSIRPFKRQILDVAVELQNDHKRMQPNIKYRNHE
jgi:hypothetical protein